MSRSPDLTNETRPEEGDETTLRADESGLYVSTSGFTAQTREEAVRSRNEYRPVVIDWIRNTQRWAPARPPRRVDKCSAAHPSSTCGGRLWRIN